MSKYLRMAGEFKKKSAVEYATIRIAIPRNLLPRNMLKDCPCDDYDLVKGLSASPTGRLTFKPLHLDSEELAYAFREHLHLLFENRKYAHNYELEVVVKTGTATKTITMYKQRHSAAVRETLGAVCSSNPLAKDIGVMADEEVEDPLKSLNKIYEPDERQQFFPATLEERHKALGEIMLNDSVPLEVRQLFETAKNLSLYSWFAYRFHQVSELISFTALEMALRERFLAENPPQTNSVKRAPSLSLLMQHAKVKKWITNDGFPSLYGRARLLAEHHKALNMLQEHDFEEEQFMLIEGPSEQQIAAAIADMDMVTAITDNAHKIRNNLAHGSSILHPSSVSTLRTNAEVINQLYPSHI